ncbi:MULTISPECIES: DpnI domain-containing protein [unclassified Mesorhizobium]|jgi:type II restriction enzyme|uniref:DpnI domain-containing protein n=1 Tax=unclassified Mesorhizobium TaxID=325217 RepID=UPI000FCC976D|nr:MULTISPECIES: DpnI domain-containing protein [unclassified Mesorhizobium]RUU81430.1 restriction endonuclease [Mesorhizobium sp. M7A.F.Ca.MR.362.00.0.0]RUV18524.1 restriction endonuclease [Mesorhizobium sp. M7A.F.Ca.MR.245.00.0.0]RUV48719.1 restriction endonuclease [Mesorhizobium sp. M7A.F.Ca.MR.228.00.0.0]RWN94819.1 MAG: restriction endonuclease [Mesorhizobium sp.]
MKFGFEETQAKYNSGSQQARVWTEQWASQWIYCPNCGSPRLEKFIANLPVADFFCSNCNDQFELKSQKKAFGTKVADGAYFTKIDRLASSTNPNLILLNYDLTQKTVRHVCVIPKHFFVPDIIERRSPLAPTARRAGWIGSNILLHRIPDAGRIFVVRNSVPIPKEVVVAKWQHTLFLREEKADARGWLIEVMRCVDMIGATDFDIEQIYAFEKKLSALYPNNRNVRPKIRQQLQFLRDNGYLEFVARGRYRLRKESF